jgi:hypothetical protein
MRAQSYIANSYSSKIRSKTISAGISNITEISTNVAQLSLSGHHLKKCGNITKF